jgi:hypothetical protein
VDQCARNLLAANACSHVSSLLINARMARASPGVLR